MNLLYVTPNIGNADFLNHELRRIIPDLRLDVSPHLKDASERVEVSDQHDAVLLDSDLSEEDRLSLIIHIRANRLPLAVIQIIPANDINPPIKALKAGADDYITKRIHSIRRLPDILQRTISRYSESSPRGNHPLRVLYLGNIGPALQKLGHLHRIKLSGARIDDDGFIKDSDGEQLEEFPYDVVVLDDTFSGTQVLQHLKDLKTRAPEIPVLILIPPDRDETAVYALKLGADQCVLKTGEYFERLLQALEKTIQNCDLARANEALLANEIRLRTLIETVPASIAVMSCDSTVTAMNGTGLQALDIKSPDWVVGKRFIQLIDPEHQNEFSSFLERVYAGDSDSIVCLCRTANDNSQLLEFRAVPLKRDEDLVTILCTFHESHLKGNQHDLDSELQDLANQLKSSEEGRSTLQDELKSVEIARAELIDSQRQDKNRLETIRRELAQAKVTIEEVHLSADSEKTRYEQQLEEVRNHNEVKINELSERLKASEAERLSLQEELKPVQEAQAQLLDEAARNQKQLRGVMEELDQSRAALEELRLSAEKQRSQLENQLQEEVASGEAACRELEKRLEESEKQRSVLDESLKSASEVQARLLEEKRGIQEELEIARTKLAETQQAGRDTAEKRDAEQSEWTNKLQELEKQLESELEKQKQLKDLLREAEVDVEQLRSEYTKDRSKLEEELRSLEQRYSELEETHSSLVMRTRHNEKDYESEHAKEAAKCATLENANSLLEDALRKAEMAQSKLAEEHEREVASRAATLSKVEKDLLEANEKREELEGKLQALQLYYVETIKEQQSELSKLKGRYTSDLQIAQSRTGAKDQSDDLGDEMRLLYNRIEKLRIEVQQQLKARKNLSHALHALALRHREMIALRRNDRIRLEALGAELKELRNAEFHPVRSKNDDTHEIPAKSEIVN